jgi:hypothetical protein
MGATPIKAVGICSTCLLFLARSASTPVRRDPSYRGQLGEGTEGPRGRGERGSSLEEASKRVYCDTQHTNIPLTSPFLPASVLVNVIAINQEDPYDSDISDRGSEFPLQSTIPETPTWNYFSGQNIGHADFLRSFNTPLIPILPSNVSRARASLWQCKEAHYL